MLELLSIGSVIPSNHLILYDLLSSCPQSFPASESFPVTQLFASGSQSIETSASASVLSMIIQDWLPLGLIGLSTTVRKHQLSNAHSSLWSSSHIHTWLLKNHSFNYTDLCWQMMSLLFKTLSRFVIALDLAYSPNCVLNNLNLKLHKYDVEIMKYLR